MPLFVIARSYSEDPKICVELIQILVHHGADICAYYDRFGTPLHVAVSFGRDELCLLLLELGADRTIRNEENETALDCARVTPHLDNDEPKRKRIIEIVDIN